MGEVNSAYMRFIYRSIYLSDSIYAIENVCLLPRSVLMKPSFKEIIPLRGMDRR